MFRTVLILLAASAPSRWRLAVAATAADSLPRRMRVFLPAIARLRVSSDDGKRDYLRWHYWDRFDFADTLFVRESIRRRWSSFMSAGSR